MGALTQLTILHLSQNQIGDAGVKSLAEACASGALANLETLPSTGFEVICFPVKVEKGSAGWCRPVAIVNER